MNITPEQMIPLLILILVVYLCVYGIVNRICTCAERRMAIKCGMKLSDKNN